MSEPEAEPIEAESELPPIRRTRLRRLMLIASLLLGLFLIGLWVARERIAHSVIASQLEELGLPATYDIEDVSARKQILRNVVIGDPQHPDATISRVVASFNLRIGIPVLSKVEIDDARLFGTYRGGKLSFGKLDPVLFPEDQTNQASGLPDLDLVLKDGRARIETDFGVIGIKAEGRGNVRSGFAGYLAATAPKWNAFGCRGRDALVQGKVTTSAGAPRFSGPVSITALNCASAGVALGQTQLALDLTLNDRFNQAKGTFALRGSDFSAQGNRARGITGKGDFQFADQDIVASYRLSGRAVDVGSAGAQSLEVEGTLRSRDDLASFDGEGTLRAAQITTGQSLGAALADLEQSGQGTLLAPLARQFRTALAREEPGSSLRADYALRRTGGITLLTLPDAELVGGSGNRLGRMNRFALSLGMAGGPRFSGQFVTGGAGLPRVEGTAQRSGRGGMQARFALSEYRAGTNAVALPELRVVQLPGGQIGFAGRALVSGALPGGEVRGLAVPIEGNWSQRGGLAVWRRCTPVAFDSLRISNLTLAGRGLTLCPGAGGAIVRGGAEGLRVAAGTSGLNLAGNIGSTPIRLRSGAIGAAWPGAIAARNLDISLGPVDKPSTIQVARFTGVLDKVVTGRFRGAAVKLFAVPLDISEAEGDLRFANSVLDLIGATMRVTDRRQPARFEPLISRNAKLHLADNQITATAMLREPKSDREIVQADMVHSLASAVGHADLKIPGILFDNKLQPDTLTYLSTGVIALAKGTVYGDGRIDWNPQGVTSTGRFTSDGLDFAAAFGPVRQVKGTVVFADLLNLVTEPDQQVSIASINPGIEVFDGTLTFSLERDLMMAVHGAEWPFMDGRLKLLPTRLSLGEPKERRFTLKVEGANAAKFVSTLELANISASGIFDGTLPLVFDEDGGRIENGILVSRPPGGNLSYVGELTYKDLSAMGNFAFQTLRSLDFTRMEIGINGEIDGDIVTNMRIAGVRQGAGAKRSIVTRAVAGLPIQFNININAPFYQLITSFKSLYDPAYVRDPRGLGLIDAQGRPVSQPGTPVRPDPKDLSPIKPAAVAPPPSPPGKPANIQDSDSRNSP